MKWINCTGDAVVGDTIRFVENVFEGSFYSPCFLGKREVIAEIVADSYGAKKQQHTFTLKIIKSAGCKPLEIASKIRRKGRNIYRNGTERLKWENESQRDAVAAEKHLRGDVVRARRFA
jgi:hypothetical protein